MGNMQELDEAIERMSKQLKELDDEDKVKEMKASLDMVKQQAKDDPTKIDELIQSMEMMSTSINDPSAMFAGLGDAAAKGEGANQTIKVEIVDHFAETNAAIREAKQTEDIDTLERVLKERAEYKSPLYFDAEKTLMIWKQTKCKEAITKALKEEDVETLKEQIEYAARPDVYMTGTNKKGQSFSDALVIRAREMVQMKSMSEEEGSDWFIQNEMKKRKQYGAGPNGELDGSQIKLVLEDYRVTHKTPFYYELLTKSFVMQVEQKIERGREKDAREFLEDKMQEYGLTDQSECVIQLREKLGVSGGAPPPPDGYGMTPEEEEAAAMGAEDGNKKPGFIQDTANKEMKRQKGFVERLIRRDMANMIRYPMKIMRKHMTKVNKEGKKKLANIF